MKLPNASKALVEQRKVTDYLLDLDHPEGGRKAEFVSRFGFAAKEWRILAEALMIHARAHAVSSTSTTKYGTKYRVDGAISCPDGRSPCIRAIWIIDAGTGFPRLVTAHPL